MSARRFMYARVFVARNAEAYNLENQRRLLVEREQVIEEVGSGSSWNWPG